MRARRTAALLAAAALVVLLGSIAGADERGRKDADDTSGKLDIRLATAGHSADGRLRHVITTYGSWQPEDLAAASGGPPGGLCVDIWTARRPSSGPPDYLVCANEANGAPGLVAWVTHVNRRGGRTGRTTPAVVSRPDARSVILRFAQSQIGHPSRYYWRADTTYYGTDCPAPLGCVDTAPDLPRASSHVLRRPQARTEPGGGHGGTGTGAVQKAP